MQAQSEKLRPHAAEIATLLRGERDAIESWLQVGLGSRLMLHVAVILLGAGCYGAAMGWWRDPQQALFTALKFPLILLLTAIGNAFINGMLAPLLGLDIPFRRSFAAVVMSFAVASAILGAFAPIIAFIVWNAPPLAATPGVAFAYSLLKLAHVGVIMLAGVTGSARLFQLLTHLGGGRAVAVRVMGAWLAGNLFLGAQLSWILRPFIGAPNLPVEFLRPNAPHGNFYENVLHTFTGLF
jgi:hypothetical protein